MAPMRNNLLDFLVNSKLISSYSYETIDENGNKVKKVKGNRNTEKLVLVFNDQTRLVIDTFCSGIGQNTNMFFAVFPGDV